MLSELVALGAKYGGSFPLRLAQGQNDRSLWLGFMPIAHRCRGGNGIRVKLAYAFAVTGETGRATTCDATSPGIHGDDATSV